MSTILGADTATLVGTGSIVVVLLTAFGYALSLLSKGTDRIDRQSERAVAAAEAERDRARAEATAETNRVRQEAAARIEELERERDFWRNRALGPPDLPADPGT